jgi:hypothetical protein
MEMYRRADERGETPDVLTTQPELIYGLEFIYHGFYRLGRETGMGIGPISYQEKIAYLDENGIQGRSNREFWIRCWEAMDPVFIDKQHEKSEKAAKKKSKDDQPPIPKAMGKK